MSRRRNRQSANPAKHRPPSTESEAANAGPGRPGTAQAEQPLLSLNDLAQGLKPFAELVGVAAALAIPLSALRILAVAGWNRETALALVANSSGASLASGLLILSMPLVIALWVTILLIDVFRPGTRHRGAKITLLVIAVALNVVNALSWQEILAYAVVPTAFGAAMFWWARGAGPDAYREMSRTWLTGTLVVLGLAATVLAGAMWLPPEKLVVGNEAELGYVLKSEDDAYVVFLDKENVVSRISRQEVKERQFCTIAGHNPLRRRTSLPPCPGYKWLFSLEAPGRGRVGYVRPGG